MIELKDLDSLKLVRDENVANLRQTLAEIEHAITQGSQGWGVTEAHAVLLHVTGELRTALQGFATKDAVLLDLEQTENKLKGKQLELGRVRKELDKKVKALADGNAIIGVKDAKIRELEEELAFARESEEEKAQRAIDLT